MGAIFLSVYGHWAVKMGCIIVSVNKIKQENGKIYNQDGIYV